MAKTVAMAQIQPLPILENEVLLKNSHIHYIWYYLWMLSHCNSRVELLQQKPCDLQSSKYLLSGLF